ncbi:uncharacterized protein LOC126101226 [Schistocerca cancellata]|uniref:uncharacterized protein LOC126101226 n=1 Tax=Schistocerca cancellata TaxID=274614 RepID=UPI002117B3FD|nr:uncharacterized protein LOC126101226 [Schistocerca cancellata]
MNECKSSEDEQQKLETGHGPTRATRLLYFSAVAKFPGLQRAEYCGCTGDRRDRHSPPLAPSDAGHLPRSRRPQCALPGRAPARPAPPTPGAARGPLPAPPRPFPAPRRAAPRPPAGRGPAGASATRPLRSGPGNRGPQRSTAPPALAGPPMTTEYRGRDADADAPRSPRRPRRRRPMETVVHLERGGMPPQAQMAYAQRAAALHRLVPCLGAGWLHSSSSSSSSCRHDSTAAIDFRCAEPRRVAPLVFVYIAAAPPLQRRTAPPAAREPPTTASPYPASRLTPLSPSRRPAALQQLPTIDILPLRCRIYCRNSH